MEQIKNTKILAIVGVALVLIAVIFMPFINVKVSIPILGMELSDSAKLMDSKEFFEEGTTCYFENTAFGVIVLILTIVTLVILFADFISSKLNGNLAEYVKKLDNKKLVLLPTIISAILVFISLGKVEAPEDVAMFLKTSPAVGFWFALIGLILIVAYPFVYKKGE